MKHMSKPGENKGYIKKTNINNHNQKSRRDLYEDNFNNRSKYVDISSGSKGKNTKLSFKKIVSLTFFTILGILGGLMIYVYHTLNLFNYENLPEETELVDEFGNDLINDDNILNVMLIGSDSMSVGGHGRSDSLLIVSIDTKHKKIKVTSLMRDIWINIPGHGKDRLNAAYAYGGPQLTISTIEKTFGIQINKYMVVDFDEFSKIIDSLGGIDMELTADECEYINTYSEKGPTLKGSGNQHLTGLQALHYSRNRNSKGSDYDRTSRQRNVIRAIIGKLKTANLAQITDFIAAVGPLVTTNFKTAEISRLGTGALEYLSYPIAEFRLPTDDNVRNETYDKKMVLVINDIVKAKKDLLNFIYEDEEMAQKEASKIKIQSTTPTPAQTSNTKANDTASNAVTNSQEKSSATKPSAAESNRSYQSQKSKQASKSTTDNNSTAKSSQTTPNSENTKSSSTNTTTTNNNTSSSGKSTSNTEKSIKNDGSTKTSKNSTTPKE